MSALAIPAPMLGPHGNPARNAAVVAAVQSGLRGADVARELGISRERVRQIVKRATGAGLPLVGRTCPECRAKCPSSEAPTEHRRGDRHQSHLLSRRQARRERTIARFWSRMDQTGPTSGFAPELGPCWIWRGRSWMTPGGSMYGYSGMALDRNAHRVAYRLAVGPIPVGLELDHLCRVTLCCNPAHLEAVTHRENVRRGKNGLLRHLRAPVAPRTHCLRGHARTAENLSPCGNCRPCDRIRHEARRKVAAIVALADRHLRQRRAGAA